MMDAKQAVEYLRNCTRKSDLFDFGIADFIEQEAEKIDIKCCGNCDITCTDNNNQQEKYAELGRLVAKTVENCSYFTEKGLSDKCNSLPFSPCKYIEWCPKYRIKSEV